MTITSTTPRNQQTAAASQTKFVFSFAFERDSDITVYLTPNGDTPDPAADILSTSDYTVYGAGYDSTPSNRYIELNSAASAGDTITIIRNMELARDTDFALSGEFSAADLNNQFDDLVAMVQQVNTKIVDLGLLYVNNQILDVNLSQNTLPKLPDNDGSGIPVWTTNTDGDLVAGSLTEDSGCSTLRSELVTETSGNDGARIVGYYNATDTVEETVKAALDKLFAAVSGAGFTTGDIKGSYKTTADTGWVLLDDGTIGSASSGASTRANADTESLFTLLWNNCADAQCPVSTGRGASAAADWAANKTIRLPQTLGRALGSAGQASITEDFTSSGSGTILTVTSSADFLDGMKVQVSSTTTLPSPLVASTDYWVTVNSATQLQLSTSESDYTDGTFITLTSTGTGTHTMTVQFDNRSLAEYAGEQDHIQTNDELSSHNHSITATDGTNANSGRITVKNYSTDNYVTGDTGSSTGMNIIQPTQFCNWMIKL